MIQEYIARDTVEGINYLVSHYMAIQNISYWDIAERKKKQEEIFGGSIEKTIADAMMDILNEKISSLFMQ